MGCNCGSKNNSKRERANEEARRARRKLERAGTAMPPPNREQRENASKR